jgi:hypothetical protein
LGLLQVVFRLDAPEVNLDPAVVVQFVAGLEVVGVLHFVTHG